MGHSDNHRLIITVETFFKFSCSVDDPRKMLAIFSNRTHKMSVKRPRGATFADHPKAKCALGWDPYDYALHSDKKLWFKCDACPHEFEMALSNVSNGHWCPYCAKYRGKLCDDRSCEMCFNKSFASHRKAGCADGWDPRMEPKSGHKQLSFKCDKCPHTFVTELYHVSSSEAKWCPYCAHKELCRDRSCQMCFENSFASNPKGGCAVGWDPRMVPKRSAKKLSFKCDKCPHTFVMRLGHVSSSEAQWCPYCAHKELCDDRSCQMCFDNSFASHLRAGCAAGWDPRMVFKHSDKKLRFKCERCYEHFHVTLRGLHESRKVWHNNCKGKR